MRKYFILFSAIILIASLTGCIVYPAPMSGYAGPPPKVTFADPEYLYVIPTFGVYFVPGISLDVFFYSGRWYYSSGGLWYWGMSYRGPWTYMEIRRVPGMLRRVPRDYRNRYRHEYYRVPYGHWKKRKEAPPPKRDYREPSFLTKLPKQKTYFYPGVKDELFYQNKRWYNRHKGVWYGGPSYKGPWNHVEIGKVPKNLKEVPPDYRKREKEYEKVPYDKFRKKGRGRKKYENDKY